MTTRDFCVGCGAATTGAAAGDHAACRARLALEPPRFCAACGRRMVVQVTPVAWTARCSRHGETRSAE